LWGAAAEAGLITLLIFGLIAGSALAGKGGNGGGKPGGGGGGHHGGGHVTMTGSLSLVILNAPDANYGEGVKFNVTTNAPWPFVDLDCSQDGSPVYHSTVGYYGGWPWGDTFTLSGWAWTSGGADCVATLYNSDGSSPTTLATVPFFVYP
jgi:hypothetical protein